MDISKIYTGRAVQNVQEGISRPPIAKTKTKVETVLVGILYIHFILNPNSKSP